jgi:uncharacterized protein (TIGR02646 family)
MVRTRPRPAAPAKLVKKEAEWTERWRKVLATGGKQSEWATRLAKTVLRDSLLLMNHGKCFFCESGLGVSSFAQIEHFDPKVTFTERAFAWDNLHLGCQICNITKGKQVFGEAVIRPDLTDPEDYLWLDAEGELHPRAGLSAEDEALVRATVKAYGLNRGPLCTVRSEIRTRVNR